MPYSTTPIITPFEGSTLAQARNAVIKAFASGDQAHVFDMLSVFYISTAKADIIKECNEHKKEIEQKLKLHNSQRRNFSQDALSTIISREEYLKQVNINFYEKIMLLCCDHGLTEFDTVKPVVNTAGKLGSGPPK